MGCNESRCWSWSGSDKQKEAIIIEEGGQDETKAFLEVVKDECVVSPEEMADDGCSLTLPPVCKPILDFAQKMSEDIVAQALQLCWEVESRCKDLPFIDSDCDYVI
ncbi:small membrane A-kinase anchor protein-like [Lates japonicus]|uniref:Small membrane A-kinase anchor protein-like protein n=1 Tax=Lates japonicus TaxID=270547 RepID=A0AAD3RGB8_LATJO|nr:small membrane A-kinase anchor protein-like protein [Lates japonicus]